MKEIEVANLYFAAAQQPLLIEKCIPCGGVHDVNTFLQMVYDGHLEELVRVDYKGDLVGFFWLNNYLGLSASIHFCTWGMKFKESIEFGKMALFFSYSIGRRCLFSLLPKEYREVLVYSALLGFSVSADLPGTCYINKKDEWVCGKIASIDLEKKYSKVNQWES